MATKSKVRFTLTSVFRFIQQRGCTVRLVVYMKQYVFQLNATFHCHWFCIALRYELHQTTKTELIENICLSIHHICVFKSQPLIPFSTDSVAFIRDLGVKIILLV